jgi:hypothetical protein
MGYLGQVEEKVVVWVFSEEEGSLKNTYFFIANLSCYIDIEKMHIYNLFI